MEPLTETLYNLARDVPRGDIVEVGSALGNTIIHLISGTREGANRPVYSVDYHEPTLSWTSEIMYSSDDRARFMRNMLDADVASEVRVVDLPAQRAVHAWGQTIGLLVWDIGCPIVPPASEWLRDWIARVIPGGLVAINDTLHDNLKAPSFMGALAGEGILGARRRQGYVWLAGKL